jgi:hypothetical protein
MQTRVHAKEEIAIVEEKEGWEASNLLTGCGDVGAAQKFVRPAREASKLVKAKLCRRKISTLQYFSFTTLLL